MKNLSGNVSDFLIFIITASSLLNMVQVTARLSAGAVSEFLTFTEEVDKPDRRNLSKAASIDDQTSNHYQEISSLQLTHISSFCTIFLPYRANTIFPDTSRNHVGYSTCFAKEDLFFIAGIERSLL